MSSPSGSTISLPDSNVLLALPDGPIASGSGDARSSLISMIGGYPTFPSLPSASKAPETIRCGVCHNPIPLLAQVYCPPEGGENDRTVYVWACPRPSCQRREGAVRAFRASVRNDEYVRDVAERQAAAEKAAAEEKERARKNPFAMPDGSAPSLFGGQPLFGAAPSNPFGQSSSSKPPDISSLSISSSSSVTLAPPLPAYQPPQYLSTVDEYLPEPDGMDVSDKDDDEETPEQKAEWRDARWEQLLPGHIDEVFERFVRRLQNADSASNQVLRYELGGTPLPYSSRSPLYKRLFPGAPTTKTPDEEEEPDFSQFFDLSSVPSCPSCGGKRVFELQLVPSLITVLRPESITTTGQPAPQKSARQTEEERRKELAMIAKGVKNEQGEKADVGEMEWGNVLVFGCEGDCVGLVEEYVAVDWEAQLTQDQLRPPPTDGKA